MGACEPTSTLNSVSYDRINHPASDQKYGYLSPTRHPPISAFPFTTRRNPAFESTLRFRRFLRVHKPTQHEKPNRFFADPAGERKLRERDITNGRDRESEEQEKYRAVNKRRRRIIDRLDQLTSLVQISHQLRITHQLRHPKFRDYSFPSRMAHLPDPKTKRRRRTKSKRRRASKARKCTG